MARAWLLLATLGGCVAPFETPDAYSEEVALCRPENRALFAERLETCEATRQEGAPCDGVVSFEGHIDAQPVVIDAEVHKSTIELYRQDAPTGMGLWQKGAVKSIEMSGKAPYFEFRLIFDDMGGVAPEVPDTTERVYTYSTRGSPDPTQTRAKLELSAAGSRSGRAGSLGGELVLTLFSRTEMAGSFSGQYGPSEQDVLTGCFHTYFSQFILR